MNNTSASALLLLCTLLLLHCNTSAAQSGPDYATPETKRVIEQMIEAHGGMEMWANAPTVSYDNIFFNPFALQQEEPGNPWWYSHEVVDQKTRRTYHDWPLDEAQLTSDGEQVWTVNWGNGNPPKFMPLFFYYFVNLPWLTQDANVRLGEPGTGRLLGYDKDYITVEMGFTEKPALGKTAKDTYTLFIDPDTHVLQGYTYTIGYGAMLDLMGMPPEAETFGPMLRVHDAFTEVDGLKLPLQFHTMAPDGSATYGYHVVTNYSFSKPFDEARMQKPSDAIVDMSSDQRKKQ